MSSPVRENLPPVPAVLIPWAILVALAALGLAVIA